VLLSAAIPLASAVIYTMQLALSGRETWGKAFAQEMVFSTTWWLLGVLIFRLCARVHRKPPSRRRVLTGLGAGSIGAVILQPCLMIAGRLAIDGISALSNRQPFDPIAIIKTWPGTFANLIGFGLTVYAGIVAAWHALTYYRDRQRGRLEAAEMQALLRQAQLQVLRSQLNPHFLFNTLHSIAELVREDPQHAEQLLLRLSDLLRIALDSSSAQEVPLAEELEFVKGYVEIEQIRLGDRLQVSWEIAPDTLRARVPSLLLQPLIENAIQHGIAPSSRLGSLVIRARRKGELIELQVHDNGPGLTEHSNGRPSGVGLANTRDRLQRLYGERQDFELANDQGLRVSMRLPYSEESPSATHAA
jgi:signal transduction histidine kinase